MNIKKLAASVLAAVMLTGSAAVSVPASAATITDGVLDETTNLYYESLDDGTLRVTYSRDRNHQPQGDVVIPETYNGKTVTELSNILSDCPDVTSVTIPKTITKYTENSYWSGDMSLTEIIVAPDSPYFSSADGILFNKDKTEMVRYPIGKADTSYTIPTTVEVIGAHCFQRCNKLESIIIPNSVHTIKNRAFAECIFESIIIPDSVRTIEDQAFLSCVNLTSLNIPKSVETIGGSLTDGSAVTGIDVDPDNKFLCSVDGVIFSKDRKTLIQYPAGKEDEEYTIPDGVEILGYESMSRNDNLKKVNIPESVYLMDTRVFYMDRNILSMTVPSKVTVLTATFNACTSLETVTLPKGIEKITGGTFADNNLKTVNYGGTKEDWDLIEIEAGRNTIALNAATIYFSDGTSQEGANLPEKDYTIQEPVTTPNKDGSTSFVPKVENNGFTSTADIDAMKQIKATAPEGAFDGTVTMNVENNLASLSGNTFSVDISFTDASGNEVQPNLPVKVVIPVHAKLKNADKIFVYHINSEGKPEKVEANIETIDGVKYVVFEAKSFSAYELTDTEVGGGSGSTESEPSSTTTPDNSSSAPGASEGNPSTGIALSVLPLALAASAVIVIKKRK